MTRRVVGWLAVSLLVLGAFAVGAAWTGRVGRHGRDLALQLEAERQRNFQELAGHVQSIQSILGKGLAAGSVRQNMLYMGEAHRLTSLATANFMSLPLPGPLSASTGKFLNQVGDFAHSVARNEAAGRTMDATQRAEMARLQKSAADLAASLQQIGRQAARDGFRWTTPAPRFAQIFTMRGWRAPLTGSGTPAQDQSPKSLLPGGMQEIGPQMDRMPVLIYDGPFSDHLENRQPQMGGPALDEEAARRAALSFVPQAEGYTVVQAVERNGIPPTFSFRMATGQEARAPGAAPGRTPASAQRAATPPYSAVVDVTRAGGHLVSFVNARPAGQPTLSLEQARDIGRRYLDEHGFPNMVATFGEATDGFAIVQYALRHRGVTVYPDQIKVRVALDNGEVVAVDSRQYVMSHRNRDGMEAPAVSREQAARAVNEQLQVERVALTIIPTETGDNEVLAYEFLGYLGEETYLVYVNAKTGEEERILQLLTTPNGTLAL